MLALYGQSIYLGGVATDGSLQALKEQMAGQLQVAALGACITVDVYKRVAEECEQTGNVSLPDVQLSSAALLECPTAFQEH